MQYLLIAILFVADAYAMYLAKEYQKKTESLKRDIFDIKQRMKIHDGAIRALQFRMSLLKPDAQVYLIPVGPNAQSTYPTSVPTSTSVDENEEADKKIDTWRDNLVKKLFGL